MSDSFDALSRRLESARRAHQRTRAASLSYDAAHQAVMKAQAEVCPKLSELGIYYPLEDDEDNRTVLAPMIRSTGRTVIFKSDPIYQPLGEAETRSKQAFGELHAAVRARLPSGWEGKDDAPDFISLADVEPWLASILDGIRKAKEGDRPTAQVAAAAARDIGDFYRILDYLEIVERQERKPAPTDIRQAEAAVSDLLAWVRGRLSQRTREETLADFRASLVAVRNRVEKLAKTVSPDDYEHKGEAAPKSYQDDDQAAETAVRQQLFAVLLTTFAPLADRIFIALGPNEFPTDRLPPTPDQLAEKLPWHFVPHFRPERLDMDLFGLDAPDLTLAGKLMLVWARWASVIGRDRPAAYRDRGYLPWAANLVSRYREEIHTWRVLVQPFDWAIHAFDEMASRLPPEREPMLTPEVRAWLAPLRAQRELERERDMKAARDFLIRAHPTWTLVAIDCYLASPSNLATTIERIQSSANVATDQEPPANGASEQGEGTGKSRAEILQSLSASVRQAYLAYQLAETMNGKRLEDREAYDYIHEHGLPENAGDLGELTGYNLPDSFETWGRYVRKAREALSEQKYTPRANRAKGRSIATTDEVESPDRDE